MLAPSALRDRRRLGRQPLGVDDDRQLQKAHPERHTRSVQFYIIMAWARFQLGA
jgi:hypothetical protein